MFISNVPEGLSSAAGGEAGQASRGYVFGVWGGIAIASGLAALVGVPRPSRRLPDPDRRRSPLSRRAPSSPCSPDTMIPEAFEKAHVLTGLITAVGFLTALAVHLAE